MRLLILLVAALPMLAGGCRQKASPGDDVSTVEAAAEKPDAEADVAPGVATEPKPDTEDDLKPRVEAQCGRLTADIEGLLGKRFEGPVPVRVVDKTFIVEFAKATEEKMMPAGLAEAAQKLAERLHQIPAGYDLMGKMLEMLEENVAGLYDPDKDCFYVVDTIGTPGTPIFTITAAHELIHAYRDVDKDYWPRMTASALTDADWTIAVSCLVEGDAQLLGMAIGKASFNKQPIGPFLDFEARQARSSAEGMRAAIGLMMAEFPIALREMFATRYAIGQILAAEVYKARGTEGLDAAYDRPPRSTEQVLHPEKYLADEPDEPTVFEGGDPTAALGEGWTLSLANVMGEFELAVHFTELLGRPQAEQAAAGWDGARYHMCVKEGEPVFFGMVTTWDTEADAKEFAHAWALWASRRDGEHGDAPGLDLETAEGRVSIRVQGKDVLVADGVPADRVDAVFAALAAAKRTERAGDANPSG